MESQSFYRKVIDQGESVYDLIEKHPKFVLFPVLAVITAAVLFHGNGYLQNGWGASSVGAPEVVPSLLFSYVLLMFAASIDGEARKIPLVVIGSLGLLLGALPTGIRIFEFQGDFYKFANNDYWHILSLILVTFIVSVLLIMLSREYFKKAINQVLYFVKSTYVGTNKILSALLLLSVIVLAIAQIKKIWDLISGGFRLRRSFTSGYASIGDYLYSLIYQIAESFLYVSIALVGLAFLLPVLAKWIQLALNWNEVLKDFSMNTYLTRKISSVLYSISYVSISASIGIALPVYGYDFLEIREYFFGLGFLGPIFTFPLFAAIGLLVWFVVLLVLRLMYEVTNAIIHIAENTSRSQ